MRISGLSSDVCSSALCAYRNAWFYPHASALADALDFPVTLLQVLDAEASPDVRPDPIEWNLRRREALRALDRCANAARTPTPHTTIELAEGRSEEHTSELQSLMRISYAVFCLKKKKHTYQTIYIIIYTYIKAMT